MNRECIVKSLRNLAMHLDTVSFGSEWYLFGSVDSNAISSSDIDLMILCTNALQADALRTAIDTDTFLIPIHLSLLTYLEAMEVNAVQIQQASKIYP